MNVFDYIIIACVAAVFIFALVKTLKKGGGCGCGCSGCKAKKKKCKK